MLTRLKVKGFKNLQDVDVRFGLFTCIAGSNGVGKSNLFDVISFLSELASASILDAAKNTRGTNGRISDFKNLFFKGSNSQSDTIEITLEMIVPSKVVDDYGREGIPQATWLEYSLILKWVAIKDGSGEPIVIEKEELKAKNSRQAEHSFVGILDAAVVNKFVFGPGKRTTAFIETIESETSGPMIKLFGQGHRTGKPPEVIARKTTKTILSGITSAATHPTQLAARREMQSWRLLQLEPSALRKHDSYRDTPHISTVGEHLPATLRRLQAYDDVAASLTDLIPDIYTVEVEDDKVHEAYTLAVIMRDKSRYTAGSLSDGTLRFLALSILSADVQATGLLCMEEPENGIHPLRIPEMLKLVRSLSNAPDLEDEKAIALRQIIINTHSPLVVAELPDSSLLLAEHVKRKGLTSIVFRPFVNTWRTKSDASSPQITPISRGHVLNYLRGDLWRFISSQQSLPTDPHVEVLIKDRLASQDLLPFV